MLFAECDGQDALAETALRCWERRGKLRQEQYFTTWNVRKTMFRARKREVSMDA